MNRNLKIAIMGARNLPAAPLPGLWVQAYSWPLTRDDWPDCLRRLTSENITHLLIAPPFSLNWPQIMASLEQTTAHKPAITGEPLSWLQEEFETSRHGAANLEVLVFTDFSALDGALNYAQASLCHAGLDEQPGIPLDAPWWSGALWRGAMCRQRLARWSWLSAEQRRLEINIVCQTAVVLASMGFLGAWLAGWDTLGWLLVLLLYPMNRPYIRLVVDKQPELVPNCLGCCLVRPFAWLAGMFRGKSGQKSQPNGSTS